MKIVCIGAGLSNIAAISWLLDNKFPANDITLFEKGNDMHKRDPNEVLSGFGGAGSFSDCKIIFSTHQDKPLVKHVGRDTTLENYEIYKDYIRVFHPDIASVNISNPTNNLPSYFKEYGVENCTEDKVEWQHEFGIKQSLSWHVGSHYGVEIMEAWQDWIISKGVKIYFNMEVKHIDVENQMVIAMRNNGNTEHCFYDKLLIGTGKASNNFVTGFLTKNNIIAPKNHLHIGVRLETLMNDRIKDIVENVQYDFKIAKQYDDIHCRTFCCNHYSAGVANENPKNEFSRIPSHRPQYNGAAMGKIEKYLNPTSNWALMADVKVDNADEVLKRILQRMHYKGYYILGKKFELVSQLSIREVIKMKEVSETSFLELYGHSIGRALVSFLDFNNKFFQLNDNYVCFAPEIKPSSGDCLSLLTKNMEMKDLPGIFLMGDITGSQGLSHAFSAGIQSAKQILKG